MWAFLADAAPVQQDAPWGVVVIAVTGMLAITFITWCMLRPSKVIIVQKEDDEAE